MSHAEDEEARIESHPEPPALCARGPRALHQGGDVLEEREPRLPSLLRGAGRCARDPEVPALAGDELALPEHVRVRRRRAERRVHAVRGGPVDHDGHHARQEPGCRTAAELGLGWFAPLDEAIPELAKRANVTRQDANEVQTAVSSGPEVSREMAKTPGKAAHRDRRGSGRRGSKSGVPQGTRGSNPLLSANEDKHLRIAGDAKRDVSASRMSRSSISVKSGGAAVHVQRSGPRR